MVRLTTASNETITTITAGDGAATSIPGFNERTKKIKDGQ